MRRSAVKARPTRDGKRIAKAVYQAFCEAEDALAAAASLVQFDFDDVEEATIISADGPGVSI
jgi:hypothetical protein